MEYDFVIYHKNCLDGYTAYLVLYSSGKIAKNAIINPDVPYTIEIPENVKDKNVIILDVSYSKHILTGIIDLAKHVTYIDHHISSMNYLDNVQEKYKLKFNKYCDINECGASLAWKYFYKKQPMPKLITYIKDNDIGIWKHKHTMPVITYINVNFSTHPKDVKSWKVLLDDIYVYKISRTGKIYCEYMNYLMDSFSGKYCIKMFPSAKIAKMLNCNVGQYKVVVVNGGCPSNYIGKIMLDKIMCDFCLIWTLDLGRQTYVISLRSKEIDVEYIANKFGGGGHKLASAFSMSSVEYNIEDMFCNNVNRTYE